jgi:hypothetical protein
MEDVVERLARVETKQENHERLLNSQMEKNDLLTKMSTLVEMQVEVNKEQSATLKNINDNLTNLNNKHDKLGERVSEIETSLNDDKRTKRERINGVLKYVGTSIGTLVVTLLIAYLSVKLGLKL